MSKLRAREQLNSEMPLRQYFLFVGGALLMLLFAANFLLPVRGSNELISSRVRLPPIRIHSQLRWPEAVVIDTRKSRGEPMLANENVVLPPVIAPPESETLVQSDRPSRSLLAGSDQKGEGRQSTRKLLPTGLDRKPTSVHGFHIHVEPNIASLRSGSSLRETLAQFVPSSLTQRGRAQPMAGKLTTLLR